MELGNIEKILEKYFEATATVDEERTLRTYFAQDEVAPHLEQYKPMFNYFSMAKEEKYTKQVPLKPRVNYYKWLSVAAAVVLAFGIYLKTRRPCVFTLRLPQVRISQISRGNA